MNWQEDAIAGIKKSIPIVVGYAPLGIAFGVIAQKVGLSVLQTGLMSFLVLSGSGQFIAVALLASGAEFYSIMLTVMLVNSRYLLFSASLATHVKKISTWLQTILSFGITDETYAVNISYLGENEANPSFMMGVNLPAHLSWTINSIIGASLGSLFQNVEKMGLNFALPAMFIALLAILIKEKLALYIAIIAALLSTGIFAMTHNNSNVLISTVIAATVGTVIVVCRQKSTS